MGTAEVQPAQAKTLLEASSCAWNTGPRHCQHCLNTRHLKGQRHVGVPALISVVRFVEHVPDLAVHMLCCVAMVAVRRACPLLICRKLPEPPDKDADKHVRLGLRRRHCVVDVLSARYCTRCSF